MPFEMPPPPSAPPVRSLPRKAPSGGSILSSLMSSTVFTYLAIFVPLLSLVGPALMSFFIPTSPVMELKGPSKKLYRRWTMPLLVLFYVSYVALVILTGRVFVVPETQRRTGWWAFDVLPVAQGLRAFACLVQLAAFGLFAWAYLVLGPVYSGDNAPVLHTHHTLVTRLPYAKVRHPMATARILIAGLLPVSTGCGWLVIPALLHIGATVALTFVEDSILRHQFMQHHIHLCRIAGRLWPHNLIKLLLS